MYSVTFIAGCALPTATARDNNKRFDDVHEKLDDLKDGYTSMGDSVAELKKLASTAQKQLDDIQSQLVMANKPTVTWEEVTQSEYARSPKLDILRIGASSEVPIQEIRRITQDWHNKANIKTDAYDIIGEDIGTQFFIQYRGGELAAARLARKANFSLRSSGGHWETPRHWTKRRSGTALHRSRHHEPAENPKENGEKVCRPYGSQIPE